MALLVLGLCSPLAAQDRARLSVKFVIGPGGERPGTAASLQQARSQLDGLVEQANGTLAQHGTPWLLKVEEASDVPGLPEYFILQEEERFEFLGEVAQNSAHDWVDYAINVYVVDGLEGAAGVWLSERPCAFLFFGCYEQAVLVLPAGADHQTWLHEIGHFLGLPHITESCGTAFEDNIMYPCVSTVSQGFTMDQLDTMEEELYGYWSNVLWTRLENGDRFGSVLAHGDFDGDGFEDLVASSPLDDVGNVTDAGIVDILYGSASGLQREDQLVLHQNR